LPPKIRTMKKKTLSTRNQLERLITIHEMLSKRLAYSLDDFARACEYKLGPENRPSTRTLYGDLERLRHEFGAPLAHKNRNPKPYWYTADFSLYNVLNKEDAALANEAVALLKQVSHLPQFAGMEDVFLKFEQRAGEVGKAEKLVVQYEQNVEYVGLKWLKPLYDAIRAGCCVLIDYQDFTADLPTRYEVSPYLLREYNNRWFLLGWAENWFVGRPFPLDRINDVKALPNLRCRPDKTDWSAEFADVVGVTRIAENPVETLVLRVLLPRARYVETKPLHSSQQVIARTDTYLDFTYQLRWNNELMAQILGFGPDAELVSPENRRMALAQKVQQLARRYDV